MEETPKGPLSSPWGCQRWRGVPRTSPGIPCRAWESSACLGGTPPPQVLLRFLSGPGCPDLSQGWSDLGHAPGLAGGEAAKSSQL